MAAYLSYKFEDNPEFISTFDEAPLWSAAFGLMLLKHLEYRKGIRILDIGSGAGFPLMELAARFGDTCQCYGLDVWSNANARANRKIANYGLNNVTVVESSAATIPFDDNSFDLIVSNLGINNFEQPETVFAECHRILKPGGKLALTTNINGHWKEFYRAFETAAIQTGKDYLQERIAADQERRGDQSSIGKMFTQAGLSVTRAYTDSFEMTFADGSAFLNHYFVKLGWLGSWMKMVNEEDHVEVFSALENELNKMSQANGLVLTVPMLFIEGVK